MARARPLDAFLCDAVFRIADSFRVGPENDATPSQRAGSRVALRPPGLSCRAPGRVATVDLIGREDELIACYERLVAAARAHGEAASLRNPFPHFSVGPAIIGGGEVLAAFPWSDDLGDTVPVLEALAGSGHVATGRVWEDQDQGWHVRIVAADGASCFVEWDGEGPPPTDAGWKVDAAALARQAADALARLDTIHGRLVRALGRDHWLRPRAPREPAASRVRSAVARLLGSARAPRGFSR